MSSWSGSVGEWSATTVGHLAENFDSVRRPVKSSDRVAGPYPYYGASGVVDHVDGFLLDGEYLLVSEDGENLRSRSLPIAYLTDGRFWPNNHAHVLRGREPFDTRFLAYAIESTDLTGYLTGSAQPKLTKSALDGLVLSVPPADDRRAIAEVLGVLDDKIASNTRLAATAEGLAAALFDHAVSQGSRSVVVGDVSTLVSRGIAPSYSDEIDGTTVVLGQRCVRTPRVELGPARRTEDRKLKSDRILQFGDVLVNSTGMGSLGRVARWLGEGRATVDSHISIVRLDPHKVDPTCAGHSLLAMEDAIESLAEGSTGQTELPRASLAGLRIRVPSSEDASLGKRLDSLALLGLEHRRENSRLAAMRDTLLPQLMSGKLRVREAAEMAGL
ncbi:restriction endonuclease subunit S [Isoptericola sp. NPDC019482]|uniref:restriction endonuclease subunit S n=1 Tax=Isoptericola sp. NPDC019482 TaxID=3154688 RepID=UPI00347B2212